MQSILNNIRQMRKNIIERVYSVGLNGAHVGPALSIVEILAVLFLKVLKFNKDNLEDPRRDRFILSKGHGALAYYCALFEAGIISKEDINKFELNGGPFPGQPSKNLKYGIEYSGGSLGIGLSYGIGLALSDEGKKHNFRIFVLMGDGELNEGTVWESAMFAGHHKLNNIIAIIDKNSMQSDGFSSEILSFDMNGMWQSCGWNIIECDGHDVESITKAFNLLAKNKPNVIIAKTIKGKGVSFMENSREWHHNLITEGQYKLAITELDQEREGHIGN
jgi:transketolase